MLKYFSDSQAQTINTVCEDANATMFIERQLIQVLAKTYDVLYADLPWRELFPVSNEVSDG